ncbi:hypothetical protein [Nonomuraea insulae]|uniref:Uncharacterized protein n=1 Tax=Nonomuraea insulae TaxID=1616787 RepID=A0ABW1DE99_9ACTN
MRPRHLLLTVLLACLSMTCIGVSPAAAAPLKAQSADVYLGGVDLSGYCRSLGYTGARLKAPNGIADWRCYIHGPAGVDTEANLSVIDACRYQFAPLVTAGYPVTAQANGNSGGEWKCHATAGQSEALPRMDLRSFCVSIGYTDARHGGGNVTGWSCVRTGTSIPLDLHAACAYQHRDRVAQGWSLVAVWESFGGWNRIGCMSVHA